MGWDPDFSKNSSGLDLVLSVIFNKTTKDREVPHYWREPHVTPIFQTGFKSSPGNYRPVLLSFVCCKLMGSII
jgi:hypothetical protein